MKIRIPENAEVILRTLTSAGFEAYVVGGCVRDALLLREPDDWDITTSASPEQVKKLFRRTIDTGIAHGTVTVMMGKEGFEVTTYRIDGKYLDSRHPESVAFTSSLEEDLKRRDFTINAMAYHPDPGLVDLFGGIRDLEAGIIRCVGDANERFSEDALRIMRAVRFGAQLGFSIEENTARAMRDKAATLEKISAERIQTELLKLLISPHPDDLRKAYEAGITRVILPEFDRCMETPQNNPHHCYSVGEHILHSLLQIPPVPVLRLTMLLHDIGKPVVKTTDETGRDHFKKHGQVGEQMAEEILRRLKFDVSTINNVKRLVKWHDLRPAADMSEVRKAVNRIGEDLFPSYLLVRKADILAQSQYLREEKLENIKGVEACYHEILEKKQCVSLKGLAVSGKDLIALGMQPGKQIGETLEKLLAHVLEHPEDNNKETLLKNCLE